MSTNSSSPSLGGLGVEPFLPPAPIPAAIAEWAALLPLVCHLASNQQDYQLAGEASLMGRVSLGLFPRLGESSAIARFLEHRSAFLERASAIGSSSREVWDVNWGSTFPCANGAACAIITAFALKGSPKMTRMPESVKPRTHESNGGGNLEPRHGQEPPHRQAESLTTSGHNPSNIPPPGNQAAASVFRRTQELHVLQFKRTVVKPTWHLKAVQLLSALQLEILNVLFLLAIVVLLCLRGLYGSAVAVLSGVVSKVACRLLVLRRPAGFLTNNEKHDACMLVGVHRNCTTWYLYTGDRGVVDYLLNKPMIEPLKPSVWLSGWFKIAHILQILAMTYVAAQKGWDGVAMTILMLSAWALSWQFGDKQMAKRWLATSGIVIDTKSFQFGGRTQMIGAIQSFNGGKDTTWMDPILAPCPRRQAFLSRLEGLGRNSETETPRPTGSAQAGLSSFDDDWATLQAGLAKEAADVMRREFQREEKV